MKRPQPDIGDVLKSAFIGKIQSTKKFKRLWGTTTVGGVEVLTHRQYYFPHSARTTVAEYPFSGDFERLFKYLGAYNDFTSSDPEGVENAWVYLNKNKKADLSGDYRDFVSDNLNKVWWDPADGEIPAGLTLTTSIVIEAKIGTGTPQTTELLDPTLSSEQLIPLIESNYDTLWNTCLISQQGVGIINKGSITDPVHNVVTPDEDDLSPNDPWMETLARYALRTNGVAGTTIKNVSVGLGREGGHWYNTYVVDIEIPYKVFSLNSMLVDYIFDDLVDTYSSATRSRLSWPNGYWTQTSIKAMNLSDLEEDPTLITRPYRLWEDEAEDTNTLYSALWHKHEDVWYLRAEPFDNIHEFVKQFKLDNPGNDHLDMSYKELSGYVMQLIDSGYQKKKAPWWKKLIAVVIFILAIIFPPIAPAAGASAAVAFASAVVVASLILTLATAVFAAAGAEEWALAFSEANKTVEPLVKIARIILIFDGLSGMADKASTAVEEGASESMVDYLADTAIDQVQDMFKDFVAGFNELAAGNINQLSLDFLDKAVQIATIPAKLKIKSIQDRNKDLKAEYDKMTEEMSRETDILQGFARVYAKPATADWSMYASLYDHPYERGGGPLALGNVQRTTKQAIRKADYNDPAFDNILVI